MNCSMEEPKVLYLPNDSNHPAGKRCLNLNKMSDNDIEYTRTDAFTKTLKWIKTEERLPKHCELVLCAILDVQRESFQYYVGYYNQEKEIWYMTDYGYLPSVPFWIPIPELKISDCNI